MTASLDLRPVLALALCASTAFSQEAEEQKLVPAGLAAGDRFGRSVAIAQGRVVGGAPGSDLGALDAGAAYVFSFDGSSWSEQGGVTASTGASGDAFGRAVALDGDVLVVGAPGNDAAASEGGAAYVFRWDGAAWIEEATLLSTRPAANDAFGTAVAVSGDTIVVGAPKIAGSTSPGAVYVYRDVFGQWTLEASFRGSLQSAGDLFGAAVAIVDDTLVAGAPGGDGIAVRSGLAYVLERVGTTWTETKRFAPGNGATGDAFGSAVALAGQTIALVGAPGDDDNGASSGSAVRFEKSAGVWTAVGQIKGLAAGEQYGTSVAVADVFTVGGARGADDVTADGGVVRQRHTMVASQTDTAFVASDALDGDLLGTSVAIDGCRIAAGAVGQHAVGMDAGAVYVFVANRAAVASLDGSGVNPSCMRTVLEPIIGRDWVVEIDTSVFVGGGIGHLLVYERAAPAPVALGLGEILLDATSTRILSSVQFGVGVTTHTIAIPLDTSLLGVAVAAQGFVRAAVAGAPVLGMCNGETITLGCEASR